MTRNEIIRFLKKKKVSLGNSLDDTYEVKDDYCISIQWVDELGLYQISYNYFETFDVIITYDEFFINEEWEEVEVDRK